MQLLFNCKINKAAKQKIYSTDKFYICIFNLPVKQKHITNKQTTKQKN